METTITKLEGDLKDLTNQMEGLDTTTQPENMNNTLLSESVTKNKEDIQKLVGDYNKMSHSSQGSNRRLHLEGEQRDQYSRRETLRITGVPYKRGEDTNFIVCEIARLIRVPISLSDISVSHRSGRQEPRAIIVRFAQREVKNQLLANKKLTRYIKTDPDGHPVRIFIDEHLTVMRANMCKKFRQENVAHYTRDGKIFYNHGTREREEWRVLDSPADFEKFDMPDKMKLDLGIYPKF